MGIIKHKNNGKNFGKTFWLMLFILTLGTVLRLIFIDKPDGLWNDEYISWSVASIPLGKNFVNAVLSQCHMPLYYLYLKLFIHFYGNSDLMLRLTSVLSGILSIISMYFVGKEFKDEKLGVLCASLTALSSFLIYFSQEVRFYELLFLFASLSLLFTLKLGRKQTASNLAFYAIFNFLIIITHTIGFVFVLLNFIFLSYWLIKTDAKYKKVIKISWGILLIVGLLCLPFAFKIFTSHPLSQCWGNFTFSKIGFLITDYFSPVLTNIVSSPDNFFYNFNFWFAVFAILPSLISIAGMVKALQTKKYEIFGLFYVCLSFVLFLVVLAIMGKLMFITKYSIEVYPILLAIMAYGLLEFKKGWRYLLIFVLCFLNLFYLQTNSISAPKIRRSEGHKIVADLLKNFDLKKGDLILLNYYPKDRFEKYFDFGGYNVISINKGNFYEYLGTINSQAAILNGKSVYKDIFSSDKNNYFDKKFKHVIIDKLKPNQKIAIVVLNDVAVYSPVQMAAITANDREYRRAPFLFLVFSYIKNKTMEEGLKNLQIQRMEQKGSWAVVTFKKK